ncbi:ABC transporter substrate-binding protein [Paenibacillus sp. D2_2]|uniref:ABC transporter substrate-binding protein n=1 Tax=Paenibacillus sp. D2_2 TaxID=3073092 RepID=UPI0028151C4B|nr:ABC transporter substrate-binding protein [Paenibacillus sp. D2_2]WMT41968.1 ABC transporter substrate-binding protein [Paenibacillus sp. D2_2]
MKLLTLRTFACDYTLELFGKVESFFQKGGISLSKFKLTSMLLIASFMLGLLGCTSLPGANVSKLKVMNRDNEKRYFNDTYGDMFHAQNGSIKIELVRPKSMKLDKTASNYVEALQQSIEQEQLDVLYLSINEYNQLSAAGLLLDLEPLVVRDHYNIDTIYPSITSFLREQGGGKLYGFAPTFQRQVIFYNIDLFDQYGIEPPHDGMTWQELIDLAGRFPTDGDEQSRIYGGFTCFGLDKESPLRELGVRIGLSMGLKAVNLDTMQVTMDTENWKQAYEQAQAALSTNALHKGGFNTDEDFNEQQLFAKGRQAMLLDDPNYVYSVLDYIKSGKSGIKPFRVGMVVGPVDPSNREITRDLNLNNNYVYAIRANSSNVDAAWELLKFMQGDEVASKLARRPDNGIPSRMGQTSGYYGINLDGFYHLTSVQPSNYYDDSDNNIIPDKFKEKYEEITYRELTKVEKSQKSLDEALQTIQRDAQAALDEASLAKKVNGENGGRAGQWHDNRDDNRLG